MIASYSIFEKDIKNIEDLHQLGSEEKNEEVVKDCENKIKKLLSELKETEVACFLSGENDSLDIYLRYTLAQEELRVKIGLRCLEECI